MATKNAEQLVNDNEAFQRDFIAGDTPIPPARKLAIVTCMDARLPAEAFLGLGIGDAHVIRNAGGRVQDALRSLVISQRLLGTNEVAVIHHTDCGMLTFTNEDLHKEVEKDLGAEAGNAARAVDYLPFRKGLEQSVHEDISALKASPLIAKDTAIYGFVYDVKSGALRAVPS